MAERTGIKKRWFLCIILLVVLSLILYVTNQYKFPQRFPNHKAQNLEVTMLQGANYPNLEPGIMFVETSDTLIPSELTMCAIESAALVNSRKQVYYFIKEFTGNISALEQTKFKGLHLLSSIHNITLLPLDLEDLFYGTPLFDWYKKVREFSLICNSSVCSCHKLQLNIYKQNSQLYIDNLSTVKLD